MSTARASDRRRSSTLVPALGRRGSLVEIYVLDEGCAVPSGEALVHLVDKVGFGWYQLLSMPFIIGIAMAEGSEMLITSGVSAGVRKEFGLSHAQEGTLSSVAFLGLALGTALSGAVADRFGRRPAILAGFVMMALFGTASATAWSFGAFLGLRFLNGASCGLGVAAAFAMMTEIVPHAWRSVSFVIISFSFSLGEVYAALGLVMWMPDMKFGDWRMITLWGAAPAWILSALAVFCLEESAHWLAVSGRLPEARDVLVKMARWNGTSDRIQSLAATGLAGSQQSEAAKKVAEAMAQEAAPTVGQVLRLFAKHPTLLSTLGIMSVCFIIGNMLGFGLTYVWPHILQQLDLKGGMSPAMEIVVIRGFGFPAAIAATLAMASPLGHRPLIGASSLAAAGALMWANIMLQSGSSLVVVASVVILFAANVYYVALVTFCSESFPTVVRGLGVGLAITVGRVGAIATPLLAERYGMAVFLRMAAYLSCLAALLVYPLRETKGFPLADFVEESLALQAKAEDNYGSAGKGPGQGDLEAASDDSGCSDSEDSGGAEERPQRKAR